MGVIHVDDESIFANGTPYSLFHQVLSQCSGATAYVWLDENGREVKRFTFKEVHERVECISSHLLNTCGLVKEDRALLIYPPGLEFMFAMIACIKLGIIAVPAYPPAPKRMKTDLLRLENLINSATPSTVLTDKTYNRYRLLSLVANKWPAPHLKWHTSDSWTAPASPSSLLPACFKTSSATASNTSSSNEPTGADIAYLQYTSGSTGNPKGVVITHGNLYHNLITQLKLAARSDLEQCAVTWLPQYHDMGLLNYFIPFISGRPMHAMSPLTFINNPLLWVKALSDARATHTWAPNFAFEITAKRALKLPPGSLKLDLSSMVCLASGGEPVLESTLDQFCKVFGEYGLDPKSVNPNYGLAENVVFVSNHPLQSGYTIDPETNRVSCGVPRRDVGFDIRIVQPDSAQELSGEGEVGEIWVTGPSTAQGYWQLPELTEQQFYAKLRDAEGEVLLTSPRFLRTGDLGFMREGKMFVCGRIKDLIIVGGKNYYPQDIEGELTTKFQQIRPGCIGTFSIMAPMAGTGGNAPGAAAEDGTVGIVTELREEYVKMGVAEAQKFAKELADAVMEDSGLTVVGVALLPPRSIPKTTSGKVQRFRCRALLEEKAAQVIEGGWWAPAKGTAAVAGADVIGVPAVTAVCAVARRLEALLPADCAILKSIAALEARMLGVFGNFGVSKLDVEVGSSGVPSVQLYPLLDDLNAAAAPLSMNLQELLGHSPESLVLAACRSLASTKRLQWAAAAARLQKKTTFTDSIRPVVVKSRASLLWQQAYKAAVLEYGKNVAKAHAELADATAPRLGRGTRTIQKPSLLTPPQPSIPLSKWWRNTVQTVGALAVYLVVVLCIIPSYQYARFLRNHPLPHPLAAIKISATQESAYGLLLPLILPLWAVTYSVMVILIKWTIIGQYTECCVSTDSSYFLRWWFVDRLTEFWHSWVGIYIGDTVLMNLFLVLMGANVAMTASVSSEIYEFDLVKIEEDAEVEGVLLCRTLLPGKLYFQRVIVREHAEVRDGAVVEPGSVIAKGCVLDDLAVSGEAAVTQPWTLYSGNVMKPLQQLKPVKEEDDSMRMGWLVVETAKILTILLPLYMFFMLSVGWEAVWVRIGGPCVHIRYEPILHNIMGFLLAAFSLVIIAIILKWVLVGRRAPGAVPDSCWAAYRSWFLGYLNVFTMKVLVEYLDGSPFLSLLYWAMGARIHPLTTIFNNCEAVSFEDMDLLKGGKFLFISDSHFRFDSLDPQESEATEVVMGDNVELGFGSCVGPNVTAHPGCGIGAYTRVANTEIATSSVIFGNPSSKLGRGKELQEAQAGRNQLGRAHIIGLFLAGIVVRVGAIMSILMATAIPAYELALAVPHFYTCSAGPGKRRFCSVPLVLVVLMLLVALCGLLIWYRILTELVLRPILRRGRIPAWSYSAILYTNYTVVGYAATLLLKPFQCTALGNWVLRFLGMHVGSNVLMNSWEVVWDTLNIRVEDGAVLDRCGVVAHHLDFGTIKFSPVSIGRGSTVQFWSAVWTGVQLEDNVTLGPMTLCLAHSTLKPSQHYQGSPAALHHIARLADGSVDEDCVIDFDKRKQMLSRV